ncbi:MAG: hypothetical protein C0601_02565 [Candidatus Muiribacterium halophilum]|uniref:Uncharacterized protein TP-0789 domain-containing protein n=1 Tax=Muiribacterium halophilum TaxID=2053465 RepID=A0A2N5ZKL3_MUIH1|nr:MAG: hypothetical protein C0601_02565 [Candidatus Muirbacterium halophilum]
MKKILFIFLLISISTMIFSITLEEVQQAWDQQFPFDNVVTDFTFKVHRGTRIYEYTGESIQNNRDQELIEILSPPDDAGKMFYMEEDEIWVFDEECLLNLNGFELQESFLGSDLTYEEEISLFILMNDSKIEIYQDDPKEDFFVIKAIRKRAGKNIINYALYYVYRENNNNVFKLDLYNNQNILYKRITLSDYRDFNGVQIPFYQKVQDMLVKKNYTEVIIDKVEINKALPPNKMDLYELQRSLHRGISPLLCK